MQIARHPIDEESMLAMRDRADRSFINLPMFLDTARQSPLALGGLHEQAVTAAALEHTANPGSPRVDGALLLAAQARSALFATALNPDGPVEIQLGEGPPVVYRSAPDESAVNIGAWLHGFFLNVICGEIEAVQRLCTVPNDLLLRSSSKGSQYHYLFKDALCAFVNRQTGNLVETILAALDATDPVRPDIHDRRIALDLAVPQLEVFIYLISNNPKYGDAMQRAVELHRSYWSTPLENSRNSTGFMSLPLTALAALGRQRGLTHDVESPYLPMALIKL
jgi:hypothetical protein